MSNLRSSPLRLGPLRNINEAYWSFLSVEIPSRFYETDELARRWREAARGLVGQPKRLPGHIHPIEPLCLFASDDRESGHAQSADEPRFRQRGTSRSTPPSLTNRYRHVRGLEQTRVTAVQSLRYALVCRAGWKSARQHITRCGSWSSRPSEKSDGTISWPWSTCRTSTETHGRRTDYFSPKSTVAVVRAADARGRGSIVDDIYQPAIQMAESRKQAEDKDQDDLY